MAPEEERMNTYVPLPLLPTEWRAATDTDVGRMPPANASRREACDGTSSIYGDR